MLSRNLPLLLCLLLVFPMGCAVDQKKEVETYRKVLDANVPPPVELAPGEALTLPRALALANALNEQLGLRGEDYLQSLINKDRAVAAFLPTVAVAPSLSIADRGNVSNNTNTGGSRLGNANTQFQIPVQGGINLFRGFGDVDRLRVAEMTIEQRRLLLLDLQEQVLLDAAQTYYQILRSERSVEVLANSLKVQEERVRDAENRARVGFAQSVDVAQARAQAAGTRVSYLQAQIDVRNGRSLLAFLIGVPAVAGPLSDEVAIPGTLEAVAIYEQQALQQRQDLLAAQALLRAARYNVDAAFSQYDPSVSLNLTTFLYREDFADASKWSSILSANIPIFSAGLIHADVRTAWSQLRQAALSESFARRSILNDVQQAYQNTLGSDQKIQELKIEVAAAQDAFSLAQQLKKAGLQTDLQQLTAQDQLLNAQLQLVGEAYNRTLFYLDLLRATGVLTRSTATTQPAGGSSWHNAQEISQPATTQPRVITTQPVRP